MTKEPKSLSVWQQIALGLAFAAGAAYFMASGEAAAGSPLIKNPSIRTSPTANGTMDPIHVAVLSSGKSVAACLDPDDNWDMQRALDDLHTGATTEAAALAEARKRDCIALLPGSLGQSIGHDASGHLLTIVTMIQGVESYDATDPVILWIDAMHLRSSPGGAHMIQVWRDLRSDRYLDQNG